MKADITGLKEGNVRLGRMEGHLAYEYAAINADNGKTPVILRLYCKPSGIWGCALWISGNGAYGSGGYKTKSNNVSCGYHKPSEAACYAIEDAGVTLSDPISGRGESTIREAVEAIYRAIEPDGRMILNIAHD